MLLTPSWLQSQSVWKKKFKWSPTTAKAFQIIKQKMAGTLILKLPDFSQVFKIYCDAFYVILKVYWAK
jgi:hypothetical protein